MNIKVISKAKQSLVMFTLLFTCQQIGATPQMCVDLFESQTEQDRLVYIEQTSAQSWWRKLFQTIFTGATVLQLDTPTMLRGMNFKENFFWIRDGHILNGMKRGFADGLTKWGPTTISTQNGKANVLTIEFNYKRAILGYPIHSAKRAYLQKLYPNLRIYVGKPLESAFVGSEPAPEIIILTLERRNNTDVATFEAQARSLMHTLFVDQKPLEDIHLP